jgi:divalent metal cation (Fe/Co/Zn/Cd) transporter
VSRSPIPLVERSEKEIAHAIMKRVKAIEGVRDCRQPLLGLTGKRIRVVLPISLDSNLRSENIHKIGLKIERKVKNLVPEARLIIHTEPAQSNLEHTWNLVKNIAEGVPGTRGVNNIHIQKVNGNLVVDLQLEVAANTTVKQAHNISEEIEKRMKASNPAISEITVHTESALDRISRETTGADTELKWYIVHVVRRFPEIIGVHGVKVRKIGSDLHVILRCRFDPNLSVREAQEFSDRLEKTIRNAYPDVARIIIHKEPA